MRSVVLALIIFLICTTLYAAEIVGVSVPVNSQDAGSTIRDSGVFSSSPVDINVGVGTILNPNPPQFTLHDHVNVAAHVPDPTRAQVTYSFDTSAVVKQVEILQHTNGISRVEGFVGNSVNNLVSIGNVFGPSGDVTGGGQFTERGFQTFDFGNTTVAGTIFRLVITKTSGGAGFASYAIFPQDINGSNFALATSAIPEPSTWLLLSICGLFAYRIRRQK